MSDDNVIDFEEKRYIARCHKCGCDRFREEFCVVVEENDTKSKAAIVYRCVDCGEAF